MKNKKKELGPLHCLYFIYYSFTTSTDENYNESQIHKIKTYLNEWTNDKNTSEAIIQETLEWVEESQIAKSEFINVMLSMVDYLNDEQRFSFLQKELVLLHIRQISRSDGNFTENEKKYHDLLAFHFGLNLRVSSCSKKEIEETVNKMERKKIGFKIQRN